jgi:apolipoprotein D and lipocalin family protein
MAASLLIPALAAGGTTSRASVPLANVDLNRMYGGWYILATIPNILERGVVDNYDHFAAGKNGGIREDFYCRRGGFDAKKNHYVVAIDVLPGTGNADWRVKPVWPLRLPFQIFYVDPGYRFVLFGEQNRKLGWIYSREPTISEADFAGLLDHFRALGYDTSKFRRFVQSPDQVGKPGFWSDGIKPIASEHQPSDP